MTEFLNQSLMEIPPDHFINSTTSFASQCCTRADLNYFSRKMEICEFAFTFLNCRA